MNINVQLKNKAIELRKKGLSYREIMGELNIAKSTVSYWLRDIQLTEKQNIDLRNRLTDKISRGRLQTSIALRAKRMVRENKVFKEAEEEFKRFVKDPFFCIGVSLYWAEGAKKNSYFAFVNSDPNMLVFMVKWIKKYLVSDASLLKYRLFIHTPYKEENLEEFWAKLLGIQAKSFHRTIYKPTPHLIKKNLAYKGCFRVDITRIDVLRKVVAWQKLLIQYYSDISRK